MWLIGTTYGTYDLTNKEICPGWVDSNLFQYLYRPDYDHLNSICVWEYFTDYEMRLISSLSSNQTTIQLCLVSLSFFVLFLPYLIGWFIYYYFNFVSIHFNAIYKNRLFSWLQIAEIFYIFYYGIKFYILYLTSSEFRNTIFAKAGKF